MRYILGIISLFLFSTFSFAQVQLGDVKNLFKVDEIKVVGNKKVEAIAITEKMSIEIGKVVDNYQLDADLRTIYGLKYFKSVEFHQVKKGSKNTLEVRVIEKPVITAIKIQGNDELDDDELKENIKTKEYSILDVNSIKNDVTTLQKFYEEKGFFLAKIDYELISTERDSMQLIFKVQEFQKVIVKKITFLGNTEIEDNNLKKFMETQEETLFSGLSGSGSFKEFNFSTDIERLKYYYKTQGYLQVNIGNPQVTVSEDKRWIFITIKINEGPKFSVNNVFYRGELLFTENELDSETSLKTGDTYSEDKLRKDIQRLTEMYQDKGYAFANVLRNLQIVPGENKVDIYYSFEKGKIAYFGKIIVKGNSKTRDKVVRRELRIFEGMKYSGSQLRISKENVNRLGFFEPNSVIFNTVSPRGKDDVLNVEISVKERQTGQISLGAGYSTATKGFFQASISQNNFRGLGQRLNLNLSLAEEQKTYNLGFTEPYFLDSLWTAGGDIYQTQNNLSNSFNSEKWGADVRVGYPIAEYTRVFGTLRHEYTNITEAANPTIDEDIENGVAATLKASIRYDRRNNAFEPTKGVFATFSAENAALWGDQKWLKLIAEARYYYPVYGDFVFRARAQGQELFKTTNRALPRTEKFTMGGARNMRGFDFEDIGPKVVLQNEETLQDEVFNEGGTLSLLTQIELEHPLVKEAGLKWVVFYDAGNVYKDTNGDDGSYPLRQDYGFGFRWFSPIGVLRFEFAYPINPKDDEDGQQFHFDLGQLF